MNDEIKPSAAALQEASALSDDLLRNIELSDIPLGAAALKASRLARLLNDFQYQKVFEYEAGGYPSGVGGIHPDVWRIAELGGRLYERKDEKTEEVKKYCKTEAIEEIEIKLATARVGLDAAKDPSSSYANPKQYVWGNSMERTRIQKEIGDLARQLSSRRALIYRYVVSKNTELKFSGIAGDAFARIREYVDSSIGATVPAAVQKFAAIYENLKSDNPEDWSNAVHGCRRVLQDLADAVFPATSTSRERMAGGKKIEIKLGADNYINRLIAFAEDASASERFSEIVGSQMGFLGDRLDALFQAAQKGSHATIATREEADRYVVYTYMIVGDLLRLQAGGNAGVAMAAPSKAPDAIKGD